MTTLTRKEARKARAAASFIPYGGYRTAALERIRRAELTQEQRDAEDAEERASIERNRQMAADRAMNNRTTNIAALNAEGISERLLVTALVLGDKRDREFISSILEQFAERVLSTKQVAWVVKITSKYEADEAVDALIPGLLKTA